MQETVGSLRTTTWSCNDLGGTAGPSGEDEAEPVRSSALSEAPVEPESSTVGRPEGSLPGDFFEVRHHLFLRTVWESCVPISTPRLFYTLSSPA